MIINIEIMFLNFFLYNCRFKKKKPNIIDFSNYMRWNRVILFKNLSYSRKFAKLCFPFDNG